MNSRLRLLEKGMKKVMYQLVESPLLRLLTGEVVGFVSHLVKL